MGKHEDVVFVYGALRSGTTVFRLMLNAHPDIENPGEMDFLFDYLNVDTTHPTGWRYDKDALRLDRIFGATELTLAPDLDGLDLLDSFLEQLKSQAPGAVLSINLHRHIDQVLSIMPNVRIVHMLRDPRDVARSSIQMGWAGTLYHGVAHWIKTETAWDQCSKSVSDTQVLEISYEGLFQDIDTTLHNVCTFFGVPFTEVMLDYYKNTTYGAPDPSLTEQWRRKCGPTELAELEARAGDLMEQRGYKRSQPHQDIGTFQRVALKIKDLRYRWRFGMKRYGALLFWAEKVSHRSGLKVLSRPLKGRKNLIDLQHLK